MTSFLDFMAAQRTGILMALVSLIVLAALLRWVLSMFGWGRFQQPSTAMRPGSTWPFVIAEFFAKIISEFRHLLALLIVVLFFLALFVGMWPGIIKQDVTQIKDGLQGVAAAMGGLIGSIIGYYFGESAAAKNRPPGDASHPTPPVPAVQQDDGVTPDIRQPEPPPQQGTN